MQVFAVVGESYQQVGGDCPKGWITMECQRPGVYCLANADGTWSESVEPPAVYTCSKRQGELALLELPSPAEGHPSMLHWVESAIASEEDPIAQRKMQAYFNASEWKSDDEFVTTMWAAAGKPQEELVALFKYAATL